MFLWAPPVPAAEIVDGMAAVVNQNIITLTDVRIVRAFQIYEADKSSAITNQWVLDKLIERNLLIQLAGAEDAVSEEKVNAYFTGLRSRLGESEFRRLLLGFGMTARDLRPYAADAVLHHLILAERFSQSVVVSLREMEDYYRNVYLPALAEDQEPGAMLDILDEIEDAIRQDKIQTRVAAWISSFKEEADIQIFMDDYPEFFD